MRYYLALKEWNIIEDFLIESDFLLQFKFFGNVIKQIYILFTLEVICITEVCWVGIVCFPQELKIISMETGWVSSYIIKSSDNFAKGQNNC